MKSVRNVPVRRWSAKATLIAATIGMAAPSAMSATTFNQLMLAGGAGGTTNVYAVSANGSVAAGKGNNTSVFTTSAYSWTNGTPADLGGSTTFSFPWNNLPATAEVRAISGDGSVFAGSQTGPNFDNQAFVETSAGRTVITLGESRGVSGNGLVVVGDEAVGGTKRAFTWTASGGVSALSTSGLSGTINASYANGANSDGSVVVGRAVDDSASTSKGVRWVNGVAQDLGSLGGSYTSGVAVSGDGGVVAGNSANGASERRAFRWESGTMTMLTTLGGAGTLGGQAANVWGMSGDGSIIVGESGQAGTSTTAAFLWTQALGMVDLKTYLTTLGVNLTGWELTHAQAISFDGTTIAGQGKFNGGSSTGWIINGLNFSAVPGSGLAAVGSLGLAGLARRRRR
jgi:probable HAF family extracellular repeat protein